MFVSVVLDPGGADSSQALTSVLTQYRFVKIQRACWENYAITEAQVKKLKKDIDLVTDYYDTLRMYQYPVDNLMAITELSKKKWKRCILRAPQ
ncbi:MAG: CRISPR-associated protein Cas2 [Spirochaetales bacterium]